MTCHKCGCGYMIDDSYHDIRVFRCWVCGERIYLEYPKRSGSRVCCRCNNDLGEENALSLCKDCVTVLDMHPERLRRGYGRTVCLCGTRFMRKSPTQLFHSTECRKRMMTLQPEQKKEAGFSSLRR